MTIQHRRSFESAVRSRRGESVEFDIDGELFRAAPSVPALVYADVLLADTEGGRVKAVADFVTTVLRMDDGIQDDNGPVDGTSSRARFESRLRDAHNPITTETLIEVWRFLIEVYGNRPTGPSSDSSSGQPSTGQSSTDGSSQQAPVDAPMVMLPTPAPSAPVTPSDGSAIL